MWGYFRSAQPLSGIQRPCVVVTPLMTDQHCPVTSLGGRQKCLSSLTAKFPLLVQVFSWTISCPLTFTDPAVHIFLQTTMPWTLSYTLPCTLLWTTMPCTFLPRASSSGSPSTAAMAEKYTMYNVQYTLYRLHNVISILFVWLLTWS